MHSKYVEFVTAPDPWMTHASGPDQRRYHSRHTRYRPWLCDTTFFHTGTYQQTPSSSRIEHRLVQGSSRSPDHDTKHPSTVVNSLTDSEDHYDNTHVHVACLTCSTPPTSASIGLGEMDNTDGRSYTNVKPPYSDPT